MLSAIEQAYPTKKTCSKCRLSKVVGPGGDFTKSKNMPDGYHGWCRTCLSAALKKGYVARRAIVEEAKRDRPCADCGGKFPTWVLQFDHLRDKEFKIGEVPRGRENLLTEIAKCDVVCANCHRVRSYLRSTTAREPTAQQKSWRRWITAAKAKPCEDCKGFFHRASMDFDHIRGVKEAEISKLWFRSEAVVLAEIAKCALVCANCHAHRTYCRSHNLPYASVEKV